MMIGIAVLLGIYMVYRIVSSDRVEINAYIRTSGKIIALGVHQERRYSNFQEVYDLEFSLVVLFVSFTFTKYRT